MRKLARDLVRELTRNLVWEFARDLVRKLMKEMVRKLARELTRQMVRKMVRKRAGIWRGRWCGRWRGSGVANWWILCSSKYGFYIVALGFGSSSMEGQVNVTNLNSLTWHLSTTYEGHCVLRCRCTPYVVITHIADLY